MTARYDAIVVGSGIAGLFTAVRLATQGRVALVTKAGLEESNTRYAQGGIAAALFDDDSSELHAADTMTAGAGLCDTEAVRVLCAEGPSRIRDLFDAGVAFDETNGALQRGLEGAHSRARVLHAGGDATGARIEAALAAQLRSADVAVYDHTLLTDIEVVDGSVTAAQFLDANDQPLTLHTSTLILASGGAGQVYEYTTNPAVATGDGVAAAFRAGAIVGDAEFYQFHPTALALGDTFLVSEAVRGEGAILRNSDGEPFMAGVHPQADLAPRDVVARAIAAEMAGTNDAVYLDATAMDAAFLASRFPSINAYCRSKGIEWSTTPVPVTPAAHYWMGGVRTDLYGRSNVKGLYAVGEVANTGVHGANRLASNSLLEGLVFGARAAESIQAGKSEWLELPAASRLAVDVTGPASAFPDRSEVARTMWNNAGLIRDAHGLRVAGKELAGWAAATEPSNREEHTVRNLVLVGRLITEAARLRTESVGGHYRSDAVDRPAKPRTAIAPC